MADKLTYIKNLQYAQAYKVTASPRDWMRFMDTASRMYRYSFNDQLLIYGQNPNVTACATLEVWNSRFQRWVNKGSKGIALLDEASGNTRLKYIFDIANTHAGYNGEEPYIWQARQEHIGMLLAHLTETYSLPDASSLTVVLEQIAAQVAEDYTDDALEGNDALFRGSMFGNNRPRFGAVSIPINT